MAHLTSALAQTLAKAAVTHGNVDPNHWQQRILNGQIYHAFPVCSLPLQLEDSGKAWFFEGHWRSSNETVTTWHVTPMQNLFQASFHCGGSHGILTDLQMRSGRSKHQGDQGAFMHGCPKQAARYLGRNRFEWPAEPCCVIELQANQLNTVKGGAKKRYVATGEPGQRNPKVRILFLLLLQADLAAAPEPVSKRMPEMPPVKFRSRLQVGDCVAAFASYPAMQERCADKAEQETGYLFAAKGSIIRVRSEAYPGHSGNIFAHYVYAQCLDKEGWYPRVLLCGDIEASDEGETYYALLQNLRSDAGSILNGQVGKVVCPCANGRFKVQLSQKCVAVRSCNMFNVAASDMSRFRSKKIFLTAHPDKIGGHLRDFYDLVAALHNPVA